MVLFTSARKARLVAVCVLALGAVASADTKYGELYKSYGNNTLGGWLKAHAKLTTSYGTANAEARAYGKIDFLGYDVLGGTAWAKGTATMNSVYASAKILVAGNTLYSKSFYASGSVYKNVSINAFNPAPSVLTWVGPVPVTVSGNVGAGGQLSGYYYLNPYTDSIGFDGYGKAWGNGWASAGVGWPNYNVSIQVDGIFSTFKVDGDVAASLTQGLIGHAVATRTPIDLYLKLVVNCWPLYWDKVLTNYTSSSQSKTLF